MLLSITSAEFSMLTCIDIVACTNIVVLLCFTAVRSKSILKTRKRGPEGPFLSARDCHDKIRASYSNLFCR